MRALFVSKNLIGDGLYIGPALRKWIEVNPPTDELYIQTLPDHVAPLYSGMIRDLLWKSGNNVEIVFTRPEGTFDFEHTFDVSAAFALSDKNKHHLAECYAELLGVELDRYVDSAPGIASRNALKPIYIPEEDDSSDSAQDTGRHEGSILISMFSASCTSRDAHRKNLPPNKMLPFVKWKPMLDLLKEQYPDVPIRFLGAPSDMADINSNLLYAQDIVRPGECMFGIPLNRLALIMQKAKLLVTIDNGMSHLAASQETPTFLMYPRCLSPHYILPIGNPNLAWMHMDPVLVDTKHLVHNLRFAIAKFKAKEKSNAM